MNLRYFIILLISGMKKQFNDIQFQWETILAEKYSKSYRCYNYDDLDKHHGGDNDDDLLFRMQISFLKMTQL